MQDFRLLVNELFLMHISQELLILSSVCVAIVAATAIFVAIELKKDNKGDKEC